MSSVRIGGVAFLAACAGLAGPVLAAETVTYSYDALGRVTSVQSAGGPSDGKQHSYRYDPAGNRTQFVDYRGYADLFLLSFEAVEPQLAFCGAASVVWFYEMRKL